MPRTAGCECEAVGAEDGGLVDNSECGPELVGPSHEFRFAFPCDGTANDCAVARRDGRGMKLPIGDEGDGDGGWLSFLLKNLPKIFFVPLVGVESISGRLTPGEDGDGLSMPAEERE
jgi:hypothetical protein